MIDSDRHPVSNQRPILKLASIDVIISNHGPIIRSMADSLLSNRRPFESEDLFGAFSLSHDGCWSSLYIICIAYNIKCMQSVKVPGINSMRLIPV